MRVHYIQHVPFEDLANIEPWLKGKNHSITSTKVFENHSFPGINDFDCLIILGGPMGIYDEEEFPWLIEEKKFIRKSAEAGKIVLGICLGAQLIADVFGAKVYKNKYKEIGRYPVKFTDTALNSKFFRGFPKELNVIHWHGETFDLPEESIHIAESSACKNQGFILNNKIAGFQFHIEYSQESLEAMIKNCKDELINDKFVQSAEELMLSEHYFADIQKYLNRFLDNFMTIHRK